jgi:formylglycine-generating enzyme required for sulfatase activity
MPGWVVSPENDKAEGEAGYRIRHEETGIEMVYVPGGSFPMGTSDEQIDDVLRGMDAETRAEVEQGDWFRYQRPQHERPVDAFWIGRTEVTAGQWRRVMGSVPEQDQLGISPNSQSDDHPVGGVSWDDCQEFCQKTGLRLPGEAEWEYAARGPDASIYPWGNDWDEGNCAKYRSPDPEGPTVQTFAVGSFPQGASWCGALDMAGNVSEWCEDWYDEDAYSRHASGDRTPPGDGELRAFRGGSCMFSEPSHFPFIFCCARREGVYPALRCSYFGFRCARDP